MKKEFIIDKLFYKSDSKWISKRKFNKKNDLSTIQTSEFNLPLVNAKNGNNGIMYYGRDTDFSWVEGGIDIVNDGAVSTGNVYPQPHKIGVLYNAYIIALKNGINNKEILQYLACTIEKNIKHKFSYSNKAGWDKVKKISILLPIKTDANKNPIIDNTCFYHDDGFIPDWDYMKKYIKKLEQEYITELEQERITELNQYLIVTGFNNYELIEEDIKTLSLSGFGNYKELYDNKVIKTYKDFKISDLFIKKTLRGYPKSKENLTENPNGYYIYGQNIQRQYPQKVLLDEMYLHQIIPEHPILAYTSSVGEIGMIDESFYRSGDNGAFQGLFPKEYNFNRYELQFILSILKKQFNNFGYSTSMSNIMDLSFKLPVQTDKDNNPIIDETCQYHSKGYIPDWDFMEKYIKAIEKIVIADVVKYKDSVIEKTKVVVNQ